MIWYACNKADQQKNTDLQGWITRMDSPPVWILQEIAMYAGNSKPSFWWVFCQEYILYIPAFPGYFTQGLWLLTFCLNGVVPFPKSSSHPVFSGFSGQDLESWVMCPKSMQTHYYLYKYIYMDIYIYPTPSSSWRVLFPFCLPKKAPNRIMFPIHQISPKKVVPSMYPSSKKIKKDLTYTTSDTPFLLLNILRLFLWLAWKDACSPFNRSVKNPDGGHQVSVPVGVVKTSLFWVGWILIMEWVDSMGSTYG